MRLFVANWYVLCVVCLWYEDGRKEEGGNGGLKRRWNSRSHVL